MQGVGGALSAWYGGLAYGLFGCTGTVLALGALALAALALVIWLRCDARTRTPRETARG